jgi:hypothetical protein
MTDAPIIASPVTASATLPLIGVADAMLLKSMVKAITVIFL